MDIDIVDLGREEEKKKKKMSLEMSSSHPNLDKSSCLVLEFKQQEYEILIF